MTSPEDNLERALRQALVAVLSQVDPGTDGLERIRARIGDRKPSPWLFSVVAGAVSRARNWTWRGHWAWDVPWPELRRLAAHPLGAVRWLRPVVVLAGVGMIAIVTVGVQPVRHAIIQASNTVLTGGAQPAGGAGTDGHGTPIGTGGVPSQGATAPLGQASTVDAPRAVPERGPSSAAPTPTTNCGPANAVASTAQMLHSLPGNKASLTAASTSGSAGPSPLPSTLPSSSSTPAPSCAASATAVPTSPTASGTATSSPTASPSGTSPTATPTVSATGTATGTPTSSASATSTASPTDSGSSDATTSPTSSATGTGDTGDTGATPSGTASPAPTPSA